MGGKFVNEQTQDLVESLNYKLEIESKLEVPKHDKIIRYCYEVGKLVFALPKKIVCEIIETPQYTYIPKMPEIIDGLCNVRDNLVPVFNLHKHFGHDKTDNKKYLLVIGRDQETVGVLLDLLPYSVEEDEYSELQNIPSLPANLDRFVFKAFRKADRIMIDYNHEELFKSLCI